MFVVLSVLLFHVTAMLKFAFVRFTFSIPQLSFNLIVDAKLKNLIKTITAYIQENNYSVYSRK